MRNSSRRSSTRRHYRRIGLVAAAGAVCLLLAPTLAHAQAIGGTVTDTTGGVLPGVTVEARSPALIEQVRTAVTDGNGQYLIVALEPGDYTVTFTLPGFSTLVREGVELGTGFTANVDGQMAVGALEETVIVTEASPTIDVQSVQQTETIDREVFEVLPTTRGYDSLALLIPAMNVQGGPSTAVPIDTGGLSGVPNNRLTIHGSDEYDAEVHVDGFDVNQVAFDGAPGALPQDTAIAEYVYDYSSNAAEVETGGVRMNMIPKEGSNAFTGSFYLNYGHSSWLANNVDQDLIDRGITGGKDGAFRADQTWQAAPSLGGPIVRDHLWFYASYTYRRASFFPSGLFNNTDTSSLTYVPNLDEPTREVSNNYEYTGRLTWQASARDKIQAYYANSNIKQTPALTGSQLYPLYIAPEAGSDGTSAFNTYQLTWVRPHTDRILFEAGYSRMPSHSVLYPLNNEFGSPGLGAHFDARTDLPGLLEISNLTNVAQHGGTLPGQHRVVLHREPDGARVDVVRHRQPQPEVRHPNDAQVAERVVPQRVQLDEPPDLLRQPGDGGVRVETTRAEPVDEHRHLRAGPVDDRSADDQRRPAFRLLQRLLPGPGVRAGLAVAFDLGAARHHDRRRDGDELEGPPAPPGRGLRPARRRPDRPQGVGVAVRQPGRHFPGRRAEPDCEQHDAHLAVG